MIKEIIKKKIRAWLYSNGYILNSSMRLSPQVTRESVYTGWDYIRCKSLELVAEQISNNKLQGAVAELGVYRGDFAVYINEIFSDRAFYLFDTFEGFDEKDRVIEINSNYSRADQDFSNTSVDYVLNRMANPANCIFKKGYFPDTAMDLEETFVFVSIDADLYQPIIEGLKYFYNRMPSGGYIFIHDYSNREYSGACDAVNEFCVKNNLYIFPLCDACGTAVIIKN